MAYQDCGLKGRAAGRGQRFAGRHQAVQIEGAAPLSQVLKSSLSSAGHAVQKGDVERRLPCLKQDRWMQLRRFLPASPGKREPDAAWCLLSS